MKMDISQRQLYWGMGSSRQTREPEVREVWAVMEWINEGDENIDHARIQKEMMRSCALSP